MHFTNSYLKGWSFIPLIIVYNIQIKYMYYKLPVILNQNCLSTPVYFLICVCTLHLRFTVWDLAAKSQYLVNLSLSVCFETSGACLTDVQIFSRRRLPKAVCDYNASPAIPSRCKKLLLEFLIKEMRDLQISVCLGCHVHQGILF